MTSARQAQVDSRNNTHRLREVLASQPKAPAISDVVHTIRENSTRYNWVEVYLAKGETLVLAANAGDAETENVTIPIGQSICGSAAKSGETILVPDISKDPGTECASQLQRRKSSARLWRGLEPSEKSTLRAIRC